MTIEQFLKEKQLIHCKTPRHVRWIEMGLITTEEFEKLKTMMYGSDDAEMRAMAYEIQFGLHDMESEKWVEEYYDKYGYQGIESIPKITKGGL